MENNPIPASNTANNTQPVQPVQTPQSQTQPVPQPPAAKPVVETPPISTGQNTDPGKTSSGMGTGMKMIITVILLALLITVGGYLYITQFAKTSTEDTTQTDGTITSLDSDINAVDLGSDDDEFTEVDQDLQTL